MQKMLSFAVLMTISLSSSANAQCRSADCLIIDTKDLSATERQRLRKVLEREVRKIKTPSRMKRLARIEEPVPETLPLPSPQLFSTKGHPPTEYLRFYLRKDFQDITVFSPPAATSSEEAIGAEFSYTYDGITRDRSWSANGVVAVAYGYIQEQIGTTFIGAAVAPYFGVTREMHSRQFDNNVDVKKGGVSGEIGWKGLFVPGKSDYLRGTLTAKRDDIAATDITNAKIEWLPIWLWDGRRIGSGPLALTYNFTPEMVIEYDRINDGAKVVAFSGRREALRVGPLAVLWFKLDPPGGLFPEFFSQTTGRIVYRWWNETISGRSGSWLDASLTHNLDPDGFVALTLSYRKGNNEDTGVKTDLYKASLSAKLCADAFSKNPC